MKRYVRLFFGVMVLILAFNGLRGKRTNTANSLEWSDNFFKRFIGILNSPVSSMDGNTDSLAL